MPTDTHFLDTLNNMVVSASSPDGTVTVRLCNAEGLSVSLTKQALNQHEDSLAYQVGLAMTGVRGGYRRGFAEVVNAARRNPQPRVQEAKPDNCEMTPARRQRERLTRHLGEIRAVGVSAHDRVRVRMADRDEVEVRIRPGTCTNSAKATDDLAEEIRTALVAAHAELQRTKRNIIENSSL